MIAIYCFILLFVLTFSFMASGTETALFSLRKEDLHRFPLRKEKRKTLENALMYPSILIIIIVSLNTFSNTLASSIFSNITIVFFKINKSLIEILDTIIFGTLIFIFCETLPKNIAFKSPFSFSLKFFYFIKIFIEPFVKLSQKFLKREEKKVIPEFHFLHEIELILFTGDIKEILTSAEKNLFVKIIEMITLKVKNFEKITKGIKIKEYIEVDEDENVYSVYKKLLKEGIDFAKIKRKNGEMLGFISKKSITFYLFENV